MADILRPLLWTGAALALAGLLASVFLLPLMFERQYIREAQWVHATYNYSQHFVYPGQLFDPSWGYGYSVAGPNDGMSFQLGLVIAVLATLGGAAAIKGLDGQLPARSQALFSLVASFIGIFLMMPASAPLWAVLPFVSLVQFPWRVLAVLVFTLSLLAATGTYGLERSGQMPGRVSPFPYVFALALVLASLPYTRPQLTPVQPRDEQPLAVIEFELEFPDMRGMTRWSDRVPLDDDSPLIAQYKAGEPLRRAAVVIGQGSVIEQESKALSTRALVRADTAVHLRVYTYYYPGWRATVNGQPAEITGDPPNGLIGLDLPPGEHEVHVRFGPTPVRTTGAALSLAGLAIVAILALSRFR